MGKTGDGFSREHKETSFFDHFKEDYSSCEFERTIQELIEEQRIDCINLDSEVTDSFNRIKDLKENTSTSTEIFKPLVDPLT